MADKKYAVPEILAILPVRDTVLFPGAVLPLTVGRESSLALVNSLEGDEKLLGVVAEGAFLYVFWRLGDFSPILQGRHELLSIEGVVGRLGIAGVTILELGRRF